jgi:serine/threonine-protein kinase
MAKVMPELPAAPLPSWPCSDIAGYASGQVLAERYELTHAIGRGGTAVVWVARDSVLDIDVAVKIVLPCTQDIGGTLKPRTIQEARLSAQLTDPAVCRVLDFGITHRDDPFVVSELLSGETLEDLLTRKGSLFAVNAVRLLLPILDALGAAHRRGIVHRDVKPENVFLAWSDDRVQPKLLDFGIARSLAATTRTTMTGTICGTPCYMSPEQARGSEDVDARSDLWSYCIVLYEAVTGQAPFLGDNYNATLFAIANETTPSMASWGCDGRLAWIVERGLEKEREARWQSAPELANALARWLVDQGVELDVCGVSLRRRFLEEVRPLDAVTSELTEVSSERAVTFSPVDRGAQPGAVARFMGALQRGSKGHLAAAAGVLAVLGALAGVASVDRSSARPEPGPATAPFPQPDLEPQRAPTTLAPAVLVTGVATTTPDEPRPAVERPAPPPARPDVRRSPVPKVTAKAPALPLPVPPPRDLPSPPVLEAKPPSAPPPPARPPQPRRPSTTNSLAYDFGI